MRSTRTAIVAGILAAAAAFGIGVPRVEAAQGLFVKRFSLSGTGGGAEAFRDSEIEIVFTAPVDFATVNSRTIRVGIPTTQGLIVEAEGAFYRPVGTRFDPISGSYVVNRVYRNRVVFDPTERQTACPMSHGFAANTTYSVTIPGADTGATKTVTDASGRPNLRTFTTTFRTNDRFRADDWRDHTKPFLVQFQGADAPGVPLDGRTDVAAGTEIVAIFSEPMRAASFDPAWTFRVYNATEGRYLDGTITGSPDGRTFTFHPAPGSAPGPCDLQVSLDTALVDLALNPLEKRATADFSCAAAGPAPGQ